MTVLDQAAEIINAASEAEVLRREVERLSTALVMAHAAHEADVRTIGAALMEEAAERDWCAEYDRFVSSVNVRLAVCLPERERTINVSVSGYVTITVAGDPDDLDLSDYFDGSDVDWDVDGWQHA